MPETLAPTRTRLSEDHLRELRDRIRAGAAWLDNHQDGWREHVTVNELDLSNVCRCVLGQVFTPDVKDLLESENAPGWVELINGDNWVEDDDVEAGWRNGFSYVVRELDEDDGLKGEPTQTLADREYTIGDTTFITDRYARELGFDAPPIDANYAYDYEDLTLEWVDYLNGVWE